MADFQPAFDRTMKFEGITLEDVPGDSGGLTFCGIDMKSDSNWPGWAIIDEYMKPPNTFRQARTLAIADQNLWQLVKGFYFNEVWTKNRLGDFQSQELANQVYDAVVNLGGSAIRGLQRVLGVVDDGEIGPMTIQAANAKDVVDQYLQWRRNRYEAIVATNPNDSKFLQGWLNRCIRSDQ